MSLVASESVYAQWLEEQKSLFSALSEALQQQRPDEELAGCLQTCFSHYSEYVNEMIRLCRKDASYAVAGMWRAPLEAGFVWMGGWRPTTGVVLAYSLMGMQIESELHKLLDGIQVPSMAALSAEQLAMLNSLQQNIGLAEDDLSNRLAVVQMLLADQQMANATVVTAPSESDDLSDIHEAMEPKLANLRDLLVEAEQLRAETLKEMLNILGPAQAGQYALAAYEMAVAVHMLGNQRKVLDFELGELSHVHANIRDIPSQGDAQPLRKTLQGGVDPSKSDPDSCTPLESYTLLGNY